MTGKVSFIVYCRHLSDLFEGLKRESKEDGQANTEEQGPGTETKIKCQFCHGREFSKQNDYFFHLSVFHFHRELLERFPLKVCTSDCVLLSPCQLRRASSASCVT